MPFGRHVLRVQRLHARRGAPRRALAATRSRSCGSHDSIGARRGRPDPPADRAARGDAGDAGAARHPPGRRQRDAPGVAGPHRRRGPHRDRSSPARSSRCSAAPPSARRTACRGARTCSSTRTATASTSCSSAPAPRCSLCVDAADARCRRRVGAGGVDAVVGAVRRAVRRRTASGAAARRARRSRSRRAPRFGWERYADDAIGIDHFGASAPGDVAMREVRLHPRARRRARPRAARSSEED